MVAKNRLLGIFVDDSKLTDASFSKFFMLTTHLCYCVGVYRSQELVILCPQ